MLLVNVEFCTKFSLNYTQSTNFRITFRLMTFIFYNIKYRLGMIIRRQFGNILCDRLNDVHLFDKCLKIMKKIFFLTEKFQNYLNWNISIKINNHVYNYFRLRSHKILHPLPARVVSF